jgi:ribonuclease P protein component
VSVQEKRRRLSRSADFDRVYRHGRSVSSAALVLYAFPREDDDGAGVSEEDGRRLGVSVGRRVGGAVVRNRVKRVLREAFWSLGDLFPADHDFVIVARADVGSLVERDGMDGVARELEGLADKLGWNGGAGDQPAG